MSRRIDLGEHFTIQELVPREIYADFGRQAIWFLDPVAVGVLKLLRRQFGPCTVNDWKWGGEFRYSGYRQPEVDIGAPLSQHRFGRAFDCKFENFSADQVRQNIMADEALWMAAGLTTLESGEIADTWVHFDTRPTNKDSILIVKS